MTLPQAVILGAVQGITEFFPISSSGHLVILQGLFGIKEPQLAFDIFLHLGSLLSILIYFRKDIFNIITGDRRVIFNIAVASMPTIMIALMFKDAVEELFARPRIVGYMFLATGLWLISANFYDRLRMAERPKKIGFINSLMIGVSQGIAVIPGISRSGATIGAGIFSGIGREAAFKFSFLLAIPAILGASLLKCGEIGTGLTSGDYLYFLSGAFVAMVIGLVSIGVLSKIVIAGKLYIFGIYCVLAAASIMVLL